MTENEQRSAVAHELLIPDVMAARYQAAIERALPHLPVKNGVVDIDSIWVETSIPYEILREILQRDDLRLPANVERVNLKSRKGGGRRGKSRRR